MHRKLLSLGVVALLATACVDAPELDEATAEAAAYRPMGFARVSPAGTLVEHFQSVGDTTTVTRLETGRYLVTFRGLGRLVYLVNDSPGNIQVVAEGTNNLRCSLRGQVIWEDSRIYVDCFAPSGALADAGFSVLYHRAITPAPNTIPTYAAYATVEANGTLYIDVGWLYDYNSSGHHNTVTKFGTGVYRVNITNGGPVNASVMITPADPSQPGNVCSVLSWSAGRVWVECRDPSGVLEDTRFSLSYSTSGPTVDQQGAHAWFDGNGAHASYSAALGKMTICSPATVTEVPLGAQTLMTVAGDLGSWDGTPFRYLPFASKYGSAGYCKVEWPASSGVAPSWTGTAIIRCYNPNGTVVAAPSFTFTAVTNDVAGPC